MDFLKEIVKEIGDDYTKLASDIDDTEKFVHKEPYILNSPSKAPAVNPR